MIWIVAGLFAVFSTVFPVIPLDIRLSGMGMMKAGVVSPAVYIFIAWQLATMWR